MSGSGGRNIGRGPGDGLRGSGAQRVMRLGGIIIIITVAVVVVVVVVLPLGVGGGIIMRGLLSGCSRWRGGG